MYSLPQVGGGRRRGAGGGERERVSGRRCQHGDCGSGGGKAAATAAAAAAATAAALRRQWLTATVVIAAAATAGNGQSGAAVGHAPGAGEEERVRRRALERERVELGARVRVELVLVGHDDSRGGEKEWDVTVKRSFCEEHNLVCNYPRTRLVLIAFFSGRRGGPSSRYF
jgi:hypothetical protein